MNSRTNKVSDMHQCGNDYKAVSEALRKLAGVAGPPKLLQEHNEDSFKS